MSVKIVQENRKRTKEEVSGRSSACESLALSSRPSAAVVPISQFLEAECTLYSKRRATYTMRDRLETERARFERSVQTRRRARLLLSPKNAPPAPRRTNSLVQMRNHFLERRQNQCAHAHTHARSSETSRSKHRLPRVESRASHAVGTFSNPDEGKGRQGFATRLRQRDDAPHPPVPQWELLGCLYCIRCSNNKEERLFSSLGMGAGAQKNTFCRRSGNVGEGGGVTFRADVSFTAPPGNYAKSRVKGGGMGGAGRGRSSTHRGRDYRFHLSPYATGPN